jgi:hypothetical protein
LRKGYANLGCTSSDQASASVIHQHQQMFESILQQAEIGYPLGELPLFKGLETISFVVYQPKICVAATDVLSRKCH